MIRLIEDTIWLTGLSGAGKSTIAAQLKSELFQNGYASCILDGDTIRNGLSMDLGYDMDSRTENVRRISEIAKILNNNQIIAIVSMISPLRKQRVDAKKIIGSENFIEVFVSTPLVVCESRDVKGHYRAARKGSLNHFTGVSCIYEEPDYPDLQLDTTNLSVEDSVNAILSLLEKRPTK
jgi:adenylyl-sulfate kinase